MSDHLDYTDWEYHPIYGRYSRLAFVKTGKDTYSIRREYKHEK